MNQSQKKSAETGIKSAQRPKDRAITGTSILPRKDRLVTLARLTVGVGFVMVVMAGGAMDGGVATLGQIAKLCGLGLMATVSGVAVIRIEEAIDGRN